MLVGISVLQFCEPSPGFDFNQPSASNKPESPLPGGNRVFLWESAENFAGSASQQLAVRQAFEFRQFHQQTVDLVESLVENVGPVGPEENEILQRSEEHTSELQSHVNLVC